jgi:hypothetical protein
MDCGAKLNNDGPFWPTAKLAWPPRVYSKLFLPIKLDKSLCNDTLTLMIVKFYLQAGLLSQKTGLSMIQVVALHTNRS